MAIERAGSQGHRPSVDREELQRIAQALIVAIGEDPHREGLRDTPKRWARWWSEFIDYDAGNTNTAFTSKHDDLVVVSGIHCWSLCEHHLLPFWCTVDIGYIARDKMLGLSKFARIVQKHSHRLQVQERLIRDIHADVCETVDTNDVGVHACGEHLCMMMRGVRQRAKMSTSAMTGMLRNGSPSDEFWRLVELARK